MRRLVRFVKRWPYTCMAVLFVAIIIVLQWAIYFHMATKH